MTGIESSDALTDHPSSEELAAYLSGKLPLARRDQLEDHLAKCSECRREVTFARRILRARRETRRRAWLVPIATAAAIAFVVFSVRRPTARIDDVRSGGVDTASTIKTISPSSIASVDAANVVFTWNSERGRPLYQLTLTDAVGQALWSLQTTDTSVALPATIKLSPGQAYFWLVDAISADGHSISTRTQRFTTAR